MEDMFCDNDCNKMTPTRCNVLITSESGDELISLCEQFSDNIHHNMYHERSLVGEQYSGLCGRSCMDCAYNNHV